MLSLRYAPTNDDRWLGNTILIMPERLTSFSTRKLLVISHLSTFYCNIFIFLYFISFSEKYFIITYELHYLTFLLFSPIIKIFFQFSVLFFSLSLSISLVFFLTFSLITWIKSMSSPLSHVKTYEYLTDRNSIFSYRALPRLTPAAHSVTGEDFSSHQHSPLPSTFMNKNIV